VSVMQQNCRQQVVNCGLAHERKCIGGS
jgi:hypothetical protein